MVVVVAVVVELVVLAVVLVVVVLEVVVVLVVETVVVVAVVVGVVVVGVVVDEVLWAPVVPAMMATVPPTAPAPMSIFVPVESPPDGGGVGLGVGAGVGLRGGDAVVGGGQGPRKKFWPVLGLKARLGSSGSSCRIAHGSARPKASRFSRNL